MSSAASDEEMEELVAALSDDTELQDAPEDGGELEEEAEGDDDEEEDTDGYQDQASSPRPHSEETEDEDDELHIAARAGIRLLEENMHFREEVLRLHEQISHVTNEKAAVEQSLADRDAQVAALSNHLREAILENQRVLSELSQAKDQMRSSQEQLTHLQQQLQQRSPRRHSSQRLSPRRSTTFSRSLAFEEAEAPASHEGDATVPPLSPSSMESPTATAVGLMTSTASPTKSLVTAPEDDDGPVERRLSFNEVVASPRRRPTLARLREIEAKYDEAHQRCNSLKLELNFVQRRVSELKPLQGQLDHVCRELEAAASRQAELEAQLAQSARERMEEQELIQSLHQTVHAYEQLNDPLNRRASMDLIINSVQRGETETADAVIRLDHNQQLAQLDRVAEMNDGGLNLREENGRLLQQLTAVTEQARTLTSTVLESEDDIAVATVERHVAVARQQYLEQQVCVLQDLLQRFQIEFQHANGARKRLEHEQTALIQQLERQCAQNTRTASDSQIATATSEGLHKPNHTATLEKTDEGSCRDDQADQEKGTDDDDAQERQLWEHTSTICAALLASSPTTSREEELDKEMLCFALLRRLVDSWTTDKPKRMQLTDWLTSTIRGTGVRRPLHLHQLSSEIAMGFQTLLVPMLRDKFGVDVNVEKHFRNVVVTDLSFHVEPSKHEENESVQAAARVQRVYHSLLSVIDGEISVQESDMHQGWLGNYSARRASRGYLSK